MYADILLRDVIDWQVNNPNAKYILIVLARYTDLNGECFPSIPTLVKTTGLSRSTVIRAINWCIDNNYITRKSGRTGIASVYRFKHLMEEDMKKTSVTQTPQVLSNVIDINSNSNTTWSVTQTPPFDAFWSAYPRKVAKGHARKAFDKACKIADPIAILTAVKKFADATQGTDKQFIPHPTTWLNGERWEDDIEDVAPSNRTNTDFLDEIINDMSHKKLAIDKE